MAPHSSTAAWKIPWTEEPGRLQSMGSLRVRHDWATSLLLFTFMHWRRKWQSAPMFLPGESQGQWTNWGFCTFCYRRLLTVSLYGGCDTKILLFLKEVIFPESFRKAKVFLVLSFYWSFHNCWVLFSSVQFLSHIQLFLIPWTAAHQASLSFTFSQSLLKLMSIESVMPSNYLISSCLQSFPASGSFPESQFFASGGQRIGASASASVLPMNIQDWFPLGLTDLIFLLSKGLSRVFSNTTV